MRTSDSAGSPAVAVPSVAEIQKYAAWVLGMVAAVTVFFQAHVSLPKGVANLNLADPVAILVLAGVSLHMLFVRQLPEWRVGQFNLALGVISLLLLLGFMHGWWEIGITQWALGGRLLGWVVLLGYLSAGYVIVANVGTHGRRRFAETLIATAAVIVMLQVALRLLAHWGISTGTHLTVNFEGYAGNRNAFSFQLLVVIVLLLGHLQIYARYGRSSKGRRQPWIYSLLLGVLLAGLMWTGSRTGLLVVAGILLYVWLGRLVDPKMLGWGVTFAAVLWCVVWLAAQGNFIQGKLSGESSNLERWETLTYGLEMWRQSPVFGAGLGVFHAKSPMWMGHSLVIHSTPVWILAEFGLAGGVVFGWVFFLLIRHATRFDRPRSECRILLLLLAVFAIFGLTHEVFYQRIFWLVLGAVLANPFSLGTHDRSPAPAVSHH